MFWGVVTPASAPDNLTFATLLGTGVGFLFQQVGDDRKGEMLRMPKGHTTMGALRACRFEGVTFLRGEEVIQALSSSFIHLSLRDLRGFDREVVSEVDREVMGLGVSRVCRGGLGRKSKI